MLGPSEGGLGGQDAPDRFPASRRNAYPSGANAFFADVPPLHTYNSFTTDSRFDFNTLNDTNTSI